MKVVRHTLEELLAMNSEQAAQRIKMGDQVEVAREIEHFAFFKRASQASAAAAELQGCGFRTHITRQGFGSLRLEARIESDVERESTDAFVTELYELIERHGGFYDGYGGPVILKGRP